MSKSRPKLTPERLASYIKEHPAATLKEMAESLGCSRSTVYRAYKRLAAKHKVPSRKHRKLDPEALREYIKAQPSATLKEIGEAFGCTDATVVYALKRNGIERQPPPPKPRKINLKKLESYIKKHPNASTQKIGEAFGCHSVTITRNMHLIGIKPTRKVIIKPEDLKEYMAARQGEKITGADFREIAKVFGCSERTAYRAFKRLQKSP